MHQELMTQISELEREVLRAVFSVSEDSYDPSRSFVTERGGFLLCRFVSERDAHCPFELHFGRGRHSSYFNFFVGAGAEFANLESLASPKDALELGDDVQRFMTSQVRCERQVHSGQVVREDYYVSEITIGAKPLTLTYKATGLLARLRASRSTVLFSPWIKPSL
jgi:hypothetical protein